MGGRMKPHVRLVCGRWHCGGAGLSVTGDSPRASYYAWVRAVWSSALEKLRAGERAPRAYRQEQFWSLNGMN